MLKNKFPASHLYLVLWKAFRALEKYDRQSIEALDLCLSDFAVLEVLLNKGELPVNIIGKKVLLTSGSITTAVDRLEEKKLVERRQSGEDRRVFFVYLTLKGKQLIEEAVKQHERKLERVTTVLLEKEKQELVRLLKKVGYRAEDLSNS